MGTDGMAGGGGIAIEPAEVVAGVFAGGAVPLFLSKMARLRLSSSRFRWASGTYRPSSSSSMFTASIE